MPNHIVRASHSMTRPDSDIGVVIEENGVRLRLNIVDTPGYGDLVNNDRW
jgi:septin family protein